MIALLVVAVTWPQASEQQIIPNKIGFTYEIHATITMYKNGVKVFEEYHAGAVVKQGMNVTFMKLTGNDTGYNGTQWNLNLTYLSIGNQGVLDADSVVLPGEWNRTEAVQHDCTYNCCNFTAIIYPGAGPYTADCLGVNYESGIGNDALFGYDTFSEVSGIDDTFVITLEVKLSIA
jgi:hypothetical protein